jgi:deoxyxylulose-5-phosphate synthase
MNIPGTTVWNPKNGGELQAMLEKAVQWSKGPLFIRYPKAETENVKSEFRTYEVLQRDKNSKVLQLTTGQVSAWKQLDTGTSRIHLAQVAPLPSDLADLLKDVEVIEVWEESMGPGGLFSAVASLVAAVQISVTVVPKVVRLEFPGQLDREQELDTFCN